MKSVKYLLLVVLLWALGVQAAQYGPGRDRDDQERRERDQRSRTGDLGRLNDVAQDLADRADNVWSTVRKRLDNRDRQNVDIYTALRNFAQNTRRYASRVNETQRDAYRDGAQQLITEADNIGWLVDRTQTTYNLRNDWNSVEDQVGRLSQYYGLAYSPNRSQARTDPYRGDDRFGRNRDRDARNRDYGYQSGIFRWRGRVDGSDVIYLRGNGVEIRHLRDQPVTDSSYDLPTPLPRSGVSPQLRKLRGRGQIQIVQQPTTSNNYTVGVMIEDKEGGADSYEFELAW